MKVRPLTYVTLTVAVAVSLRAQSVSTTFPMDKGTVWMYAGSVAWQEGPQIHRIQLSWRSEIMASVQRRQFRIALLMGHPSDLAWYERGRQRECYLLTSVDDRELYLHQIESGCALPDGDPSSFIDVDDLILKLPAKKGQSFGGDPDRKRNDGLYAWQIENRKLVKPSGIKGIVASRAFLAYVLAYRTLADHQLATYAAGIGLTEYVYSHHGTVSEVSMRLTEFRPENAPHATGTQ